MTKNPRLVVVDDHVLFRQGITALLRDYPDLSIVGEASNGIEALERCRALQPDVVLIDADLHFDPAPHLSTNGTGQRDGLEITRRIREELPDTRVVLLASKSEPQELVYEAIKSGALGFVTKTSEIGELVTAIRSVARGQASITMGSLTNLIMILGNPSLAGQDQSEVLEEPLSEREEEVLELVAQGQSNREIAMALFISESTVRSHLHNILDKLQLSNRVQAATYALTSRKRRALVLSQASRTTMNSTRRDLRSTRHLRARAS